MLASIVVSIILGSCLFYQIVVLKTGRVVEAGTHTSLLVKDNFYAYLWKAQESSKIAG